ncbi:hypothetical protein [Nocardia rhizosphaerihabitans]|uniref:Uncharacterized protein n=1 Tax=Nocardia rhizosphaerihabitans TaxID=1691570 RepID=A0ABQ2KJ25_9NOCA|nr:hypothetical protein [Nocardia rhizosphaerihabitans]GGN82878.1 hypothetical protein GCM10011610_34750 [Nocardia rhizosphaerihabitans]
MKVLATTAAKVVIAGGVAAALIGLGAGAASAQPHDSPDPGRPGPAHQEPQAGHQQGPQRHGFWFLDRWVPLPW